MRGPPVDAGGRSGHHGTMESPMPRKSNPYPEFVFVDCESTGLARPSYPIEVGIARCDGGSEGHLVRPSPSWSGIAWDPAALPIHNLTREQVERDGKDPRWVAEWLNRELAGKTACSDNPHFEAYWLGVLFHAAGVEPAFGLEDTYSLVSAALISTQGDASGFDALRERVRREAPYVHRAAADALFWATMFREAMTPPGPVRRRT